MLDAHIDYDASVVAAENEYAARMAWEEINSMDVETAENLQPQALAGDLNEYGDDMPF